MLRSFFSRSVVSKALLVLLVTNIFASVASAASSTLTIEAGADQTLTLGDALVLDTEAYVQNLSTSALTAATIDWGDGSPVDTASIVFDASAMYLQGTHTYTAVDSYLVTVCADDDGTGTICDTFMATVEAAGQPDLTATNMVITPASTAGEYYVTVDLANIGTVSVDPSTSGTLPLSVNGVYVATYNWSTFGSSHQTFLTAGGSNAGIDAAGAPVSLVNGDFLELCVDDTNIIAESDETNNCVSETFVDPSALPDLQIDSVAFDTTSGARQFRIAVSNVGAGVVPTDADLYFSYDLTADMNPPTGATPSADFNAVTLPMAFETDVDGVSSTYQDVGGTTEFLDLTIPDVTAAGDPACTAYVLAVIDPAGAITEETEGAYEANYYRATIDLCASPDFQVADVYAWDFVNGLFLDVNDVPTGSDPTDYELYFDVTNAGGDVDAAYSQEFVQFLLCDTSCATDTDGLDYTASAPHTGGFFGVMTSLHAGGTDSDNAEEIYIGDVDVSNIQTFEYCIDTTSYVPESNEENNCASFSNPFYVEKPDLVVTNMVIDPTDYSLDITVTNEGTVDVAEDADPQLQLDVTNSSITPDGSGTYDLDTYVTADADYRIAGHSMVISLPGSVESATTLCEENAGDITFDLTATVDSTDTVLESNETNNVYQYLSVDFCSFLSTTSTGIDLYVENNDTITDLILKSELGNSGTVDVPTSYITDDLGTNYLYIDGVRVRQARWMWHTVGALRYTAAGGSQVRYFVMYYVSTLASKTYGTHTVSVCIDGTDVVLEDDESNNCDTTTFELTDLPDLYSVINSYDAATYTVNFTLGNDSTINVLDWFGNYVVRLNGTTMQTQNWLTDTDVSYLNAGGTLDKSYAFESSDLIEGTNTVEICMDYSYYIAESDETNNCVSTSFTVSTSTTGSETGSESGSGSDSGSGSGSETSTSTTSTTTSSSSSSSGGSSGAGFVAGGSHHSSSSSDSNVDLSSVDGAGSEDVVLTEEEVAACGEMSFVDVATDDPAYDSIYRMWCEGVIHGRDAQHFAPSENVHRDEVSKIVSRLFGYVTFAHEDLPEATGTYYGDVTSAEPLAYYVETLTEEGFYTDEKAAGNFRPHDDMTYGEIVDLLNQVSGRTVSLDGYSDDDSMSRGSFADFVFSLFE